MGNGTKVRGRLLELVEVGAGLPLPSLFLSIRGVGLRGSAGASLVIISVLLMVQVQVLALTILKSCMFRKRWRLYKTKTDSETERSK